MESVLAVAFTIMEHHFERINALLEPQLKAFTSLPETSQSMSQSFYGLSTMVGTIPTCMAVVLDDFDKAL